eukprot:TRINITY_DN5946_c0_g1_i1.p1 TRINITY_DN5946_c0_g1~~TRINITY_DN5946_c0_g1_i1.p1  ORF type:complete len:338 (+),score=37.77 TRINITY_DN5946_c0_g1_i1:258-1271(+)
MSARPLFKFGVVADCQYADVDDAFNFHKTRLRRYRNSLDILSGAVDAWNRDIESDEQQHGASDFDFVAQLGDLLDGQAKKQEGGPVTALNSVMAQVQRCACQQWYHCIGNHELYCFSREELNTHLQTAPAPRGLPYYDWSPRPGWRVVMLDPYDISLLGCEANSTSYQEALSILTAHNSNNVQSTGVDWTLGMKGEDKRYMPYNGALGAEQLLWLEEVVDAASLASECIIILTHVPLYMPASRKLTVVWNREEVLRIIRKHHGVVTAVFAGHDHAGGFATDESGIHHITVPATLECEVGEVSYGTVEVWSDRLELKGEGKLTSRELPLVGECTLPRL